MADQYNHLISRPQNKMIRTIAFYTSLILFAFCSRSKNDVVTNYEYLLFGIRVNDSTSVIVSITMNAL